jgi:O-antigen/teichoic acid export membrane protein
MKHLVRHLSSRVRHRPDIRQAGLLLSAQATSQLVLLATAPVLARLYAPEDFGEYAALVSLSTLFASVMSLGYPVALYFPKSRRLLLGVFQLCAYATLACAVLLAFVLSIVEVLGLFGLFERHPWTSLSLLVLSAILLSYQNNANAYQARIDQYRSIAYSRFNVTFFPTILQIGAAFTPLQAVGLQIGRVAGQFATLAVTEFSLPRGFDLLGLFNPSWPAIRRASKQYADSLIHVPRLLLVRGATTLTPVLLLAFYDPATAGLYFFADRLIAQPGRLLNDTLSRIPLKNFTECLREGRPVLRLGLGYTVLLAAFGAPAVLLLALSGQWIFTVLFGSAWVAAAPFATVVAIPAAARLALMPMSALIPALRLQRWSTFIYLFFFFRVLLIPAAHTMGLNALWAIGMVSALTAAYDVTNFIIAYFAGRAHDRTLPRIEKDMSEAIA